MYKRQVCVCVCVLQDPLSGCWEVCSSASTRYRNAIRRRSVADLTNDTDVNTSKSKLLRENAPWNGEVRRIHSVAFHSCQTVLAVPCQASLDRFRVNFNTLEIIHVTCGCNYVQPSGRN